VAVCELGCLHFSFVFGPSVDTVHERVFMKMKNVVLNPQNQEAKATIA